MATIKDVAKRAGVSTTTASVVLSGRAEEKKITKDTQKHVLAAAADLRYKPNLAARRLRAADAQEYRIGIFWSMDTRANVLTRILQGVQRARMESDSQISLTICPFEGGRLFDEPSFFSTSAFDGIILATVSAEELKRVEGNPPAVPVMLLNRASERFHCVRVDNAGIGAMIADQFAAVHAESAGAVILTERYPAVEARRNAFFARLAQRGVSIEERHVVKTEDSLSGGVFAGELLLSRGPLPKAIYCDDDSVALGVLHALRARGVAVPEEVRLMSVGMGAAEHCRYSDPPLSIVDIPYEKLAARCLTLLIAALEDGGASQRREVLPFEVFLRKSC